MVLTCCTGAKRLHCTVGLWQDAAGVVLVSCGLAAANQSTETIWSAASVDRSTAAWPSKKGAREERRRQTD